MNERTVQSAADEYSPPPAHTPGWEAFEDALTSALSVLEEEFLIVSARDGNRFVQFHVSRVDGVLAETASNAYRGPDRQLDAGQLAALVSLKWAAPTRAPDCARTRPEGVSQPLPRVPAPVLLRRGRPLRGRHADRTPPRREPRRTPVQGLRRGRAHRHPPGAAHRAGPGATDPGEGAREAQEARRVRQAPRQGPRRGSKQEPDSDRWSMAKTARFRFPSAAARAGSVPARIPSTCACTSTSSPASKGTRRSWDGCTR